MTPELTREIIIGSVAAVATALFTGIPAVLLFWWTWRRDQERLIVQKLIPNWPAITGKWIPQKDKFGPVFHVLVRNPSLFPVYISAAGFSVDGEVIELEHPFFPAKMKRNPDPKSSYVNIPDDESDPREIPSQKFKTISVYDSADRTKIAAALDVAAQRHSNSVEEILISSMVIAIVATQAGREFTSAPFPQRIWRRFLEIKKQMDH